MDLDNPSYFSLLADHKKTQKMGNTDSTSECSLSRTSTPPKNQKRHMRSFLRSVSSNSADSNQELLIMGEPRLSDIAPDLAFKHQNRSGSLRSKEGPGDVLYNLVPTEEEAELSGDEVFLAEDTATYYNYSPGKNPARRHSIGTFINRERTSSVASSFKEDFPQAIVHATSDGDSPFDDHSLRHASFPRKRCPRCTRGE